MKTIFFWMVFLQNARCSPLIFKARESSIPKARLAPFCAFALRQSWHAFRLKLELFQQPVFCIFGLVPLFNQPKL